jgi:hypothetical protein
MWRNHPLEWLDQSQEEQELVSEVLVLVLEQDSSRTVP